MSRLSVRLAAVTLVVGLLGGLIGGLIVRQSTRGAIQAEAERRTAGLAARVAGEIDDRIDGYATSLGVLATQADITALSDGAELELVVALRALDVVEELDLHDADGHLVAAVAEDRLVDRSRVAPGPLVGPGARQVDLVSVDPVAVDITVAVENPPGSVVGSLRGRVRLESIVQVLEARLLGSTANAMFLDADGVILEHPERNRVIAREVYPVSSIGPDGVGSLERDGTSVLAAVAPTSGLPGAVVIEWDEDEALSVANRSATLVGLLVGLTVLTTVAMILVFTSRLLRPLEGLRSVLRRLGEGDHDARVAEVGSTEFRQVAREVNSMASAVRQQIAEITRAQEDLREAEDRFRRIIDSSPDVFVVVDDDGRIEMASGRVQEMFGYEASTLVGQRVEMLVPDHLRDAHEGHRASHAMEAVREMGSQLELYGRRADGSRVPVEIALSPIVIDHRLRVLATVRDVTLRREGEAATRELSDMRARQRQAIEINDNIVQGLTVARWSFDLGEVDAARRAVERTVETARVLVDRMLSLSGDVEPGALRREQPAGPENA